MSKTSQSYLFLNLHAAPLVRLAFITAVLLIVPAAILRLPYLMILLALAVISGCYILFRIGTITIRQSKNGKALHIRTTGENYYIETPISYESWWTYKFIGGKDLSAQLSHGVAEARSNSILVYIKLTNPKGKVLYIEECIDFDTRFPNEVQHKPKIREMQHSLIRVQRVDKLLLFLKESVGITPLNIDNKNLNV